jgi:hypothetical protein
MVNSVRYFGKMRNIMCSQFMKGGEHLTGANKFFFFFHFKTRETCVHTMKWFPAFWTPDIRLSTRVGVFIFAIVSKLAVETPQPPVP